MCTLLLGLMALPTCIHVVKFDPFCCLNGTKHILHECEETPQCFMSKQIYNRYILCVLALERYMSTQMYTIFTFYVFCKAR